jgi:predicted ABC-type exoprotein transport system permease subunit
VKLFREIIKFSKPTPFKLIFTILLSFYFLPVDYIDYLNHTRPGGPCGYHLSNDLTNDFHYIMDAAMSTSYTRYSYLERSKLVFLLFFELWLRRFIAYYFIFSAVNGYIFSISMALNETLRKSKKTLPK